MDGILLVDKPRGKTSHDVVAAIRRERGESRAGHAGTLDPLATGLLVVALGKGLRLLEFMAGHDKEYEVEIELGALTETDDADGPRVAETPVPGRAALEAAAAAMRGEIEQTPPQYSAVKIDGRRAYDLARQGKDVEIPARKVRIDVLDLLSYEPPRARFRVKGSKGLYVRSIARDLGGHVAALRRLASGPFRVEDAGPALLPIEAAVAHLPEFVLDDAGRRFFETGRQAAGAVEGLVRVTHAGRFLGIGEPGEPGWMKPRKVLAP